MWLSGTIFPFLMTWGLFKKKWLLFLAGALGQIMLYATAGAKSVLLSILFIPAIYILLRGTTADLRIKSLRTIIICVVTLNCPTTILGTDPAADTLNTGSSPVLLRCFGI